MYPLKYSTLLRSKFADAAQQKSLTGIQERTKEDMPTDWHFKKRQACRSRNNLLLTWRILNTKGLFSKFHFMKVISSSKVVKWNLNMMVLFISFCWLFLNIFICWSIGIWMEIIQYIAFITKHRFTKKDICWITL